MKAWIYQDSKQVQKKGEDKASWYVGWFDPEGKNRCKSCGPGSRGHNLAEKEQRRIEAELLTGTYQSNAKKTWADFRREYEEKVLPGLAVRMPSGEWFAPPVIPGTFLINLGNMMRRWSNDRFLSTPHGVINESGTDRYSIAYFHSPNPASTIECLPSCVSADNPARYEPAVYRDLVMEFYRKNYFHQKGHRANAVNA